MQYKSKFGWSLYFKLFEKLCSINNLALFMCYVMLRKLSTAVFNVQENIDVILNEQPEKNIHVVSFVLNLEYYSSLVVL